MSVRKKVVVIGAGVAGLTVAARLSYLGYDTTLLERSGAPGGRAQQAKWDGFTFDLGPTLLFMLDVFREAFASWGSDFDSEVPCVRLRPNYRLNFADGRSLDVSPLLSETMASMEHIAPGSSRGVLSYLAGSARAYETSLREFVRDGFEHPSSLFTPKKVHALFRAGAFRRLSSTARKAFGSDGIAAGFSLQSMYLGMSPFSSPEMYRLLFFTEMGQGIYFPYGGIGALPAALERCAVRNGTKIYYRAAVTALERRGAAVRAVIAGERRFEADCTIVCADLAYAYDALLNERKHRSQRMQHTPSALLLYAALDEGYRDLLHHEFLMPADLRATCSDLFDNGSFPNDPAVYLCAPARTDATMAPPGGEALYMLIPVPNLTGKTDWTRDGREIEERVLDVVERRRLPGLRSRVRFVRSRNPDNFRDELNLHSGSAFGLSHGLTQIGPFRPANRHRRYRNLYFAGASTRPATGLPLVTLSALQAADRIVREMALRA